MNDKRNLDAIRLLKPSLIAQLDNPPWPHEVHFLYQLNRDDDKAFKRLDMTDHQTILLDL